jgi:hypothetical protein
VKREFMPSGLEGSIVARQAGHLPVIDLAVPTPAPAVSMCVTTVTWVHARVSTVSPGVSGAPEVVIAACSEAAQRRDLRI